MMSKELKALKRLHEETKGNHNTSPFSNRSDYDLLKQSLKRNDPMKVLEPQENEHEGILAKCPNCKNHIYYDNYEDFNFCIRCGQKLDWGDLSE